MACPVLRLRKRPPGERLVVGVAGRRARRRMGMNTYMEGVRDALTRVGLVRNSTSPWMTGVAISAGEELGTGAIMALLLTPSYELELRLQIRLNATPRTK